MGGGVNEKKNEKHLYAFVNEVIKPSFLTTLVNFKGEIRPFRPFLLQRHHRSKRREQHCSEHLPQLNHAAKHVLAFSCVCYKLEVAGWVFCESAGEHFSRGSLKMMPPHLASFISFIWQRRRSATSVVKCLCLPGGQCYVSVRGMNRNRVPPLRNGGACLKFIVLPNRA